MNSTAPNWLLVFKISTSLLAGLIFLGLIIWGYFKTKNPGYIIIGGANILHIFFQIVRVVIMMLGFAIQPIFGQINIILGYLNFLLFFILVIGLIVLIVKSEKKTNIVQSLNSSYSKID